MIGDSVRKLFPHATKFIRTLLRAKTAAAARAVLGALGTSENAASATTATTATTATNQSGGTVAATTISASGLLSVNGGQIAFPAAQNASAGANVLDDYEEGTWTPSLGGSATYIVAEGTYTKVGRIVFVRGRLIVNVIGTGSATTIFGLPFTVADPMGVCTVGRLVGSVTSVVACSAEFVTASTTMQTRARTAASVSDATTNIFTSATEIVFNGFYFA